MSNRPTIKELEAILDAEEDTPIEILPNGEVRPLGKGSAELGGERRIRYQFESQRGKIHVMETPRAN